MVSHSSTNGDDLACILAVDGPLAEGASAVDVCKRPRSVFSTKANLLNLGEGMHLNFAVLLLRLLMFKKIRSSILCSTTTGLPKSLATQGQRFILISLQ